MKLVLIVLITWGQTVYAVNFAAPQTYKIRYSIEIPATDNKNSTLSLWAPYPPDSNVQEVKSFKVNSQNKNITWKVNSGKKYGNKMVYLHGEVQDQPIKISFTYTITRLPDQGSNTKELIDLNSPEIQKFLLPNKLVPLHDLITKMAATETEGIKNPTVKIKKIYNYVVSNMKYDKSEKGYGRGDAIWACNRKKGNCTDFHSLFIAMARTQNLPAKFLIGLPIPNKNRGVIKGYHCWAQVFDPNSNWMPLDASESYKSGEPFKYFGYLPSNRIHFSTGRDIVLNPAQQGEDLNYFIYPYAEIDGKKMSSIKTSFYFERI